MAKSSIVQASALTATVATQEKVGKHWGFPCNQSSERCAVRVAKGRHHRPDLRDDSEHLNRQTTVLSQRCDAIFLQRRVRDGICSRSEKLFVAARCQSCCHLRGLCSPVPFIPKSVGTQTPFQRDASCQSARRYGDSGRRCDRDRRIRDPLGAGDPAADLAARADLPRCA